MFFCFNFKSSHQKRLKGYKNFLMEFRRIYDGNAFRHNYPLKKRVWVTR